MTNETFTLSTIFFLFISQLFLCTYYMFSFHFQKKEWLCLTCQTQRAMSGSLGDIHPPVPSPIGSPELPGPANQQQQRGAQSASCSETYRPSAAKATWCPSKWSFFSGKARGATIQGPLLNNFLQLRLRQKKQDQGINRKQAMFKTEKEGDIKATSKKGTSDKKDEKKSSGMQKSKHDDVSGPPCPHNHCLCPS